MPLENRVEGSEQNPTTNSSTSFTPGPWHTENGQNVRTVNGDGAIADVYDGVRGLHYDEAKTAANARLIAAAPDMYDALAAAHAAILAFTSEEYEAHASPALRKISRALAKARGEVEERGR